MRHAPTALVLLLAGCAATSQPASTAWTPSESAAVPALPAAEPSTEAPAQGTGSGSGYSYLEQTANSSREPSERGLQPGQTLLQGYIGALLIESLEVEGGGDLDYIDEPDLDDLPMIGGGAQWVLGGDRIDLGFEGGLAFNFSTGGGAVLVGGGGAAVAVDVDLLLVDLYGGFFASTFLGRKVRVYGGVGPLLQFADYDQSGGGFDDGGSGFGFGYYVRTGFEFVLASRTMLGLGARWSDCKCIFY
jgi:hypothetical protein